MQDRVLFFVALTLFWTAFAKFISIPPEGELPVLAVHDAGDIAIWTPPGL